jgi:hypothetical protein
MTHNAERLIRHPEVRPDLGIEQIRDILWTYSSPDLYSCCAPARLTLAAYGDFLFYGMTGQLLNSGVDSEASGQCRPRRSHR